jgi:hypothetical protein
MTSRFAVAIVTLAVLLSALPWEIVATVDPAPYTSNAVADSVRFPVPGPLESGDPCPDDCICLCCPGRSVSTPASTSAVASCQTGGERLEVSLRQRPSSDLSRLIFHPPRPS